MTLSRTPGIPVVENGELVSTNPATGEEAGRFAVTTPTDVAAAVDRARAAAVWWRELGFAGRRTRLLRFRSLIARRLPELTALMHTESGRPHAEAVVEATAAIEHIAWAATNAKRVLGPRRVRSSLLMLEYSSHLEYPPVGVLGVIGPWNYPVFTPIGSIGYGLAAGNAVVFKPSEYTPATGQWLVDTFAEAVPEHPVLQAVHGAGEVGGALCRSGVDKISFTGSTPTGRRVMAACAETLTPVLLECGGNDALIVEADADLDAAADACVWGALTNAGQSCVGIERVYVAERVYEDFLARLVAQASKLRAGVDEGADIGPITMPGQIEIIRRHITDALARGGRAVLGGADAVQPPYVQPTILVDVPDDAAAQVEETFGPTMTVTRVRDGADGVDRANAGRLGLGGAVFSRANGMALARRMHSGMTSINGTLTFAGMPSLPFGGTGDSGFGRIHGDDGLREFARPKAITKRRAASVLPAASFNRTPARVAMIARVVRLIHGRSR